MKKLLIGILFLLPFAAHAGLIVNGYEWEVRGTSATFADHQTQAAADTGWTWASVAQFQDLGPTVYDPLIGDLSSNVWLNDSPDGLGSRPVVYLLNGSLGISGRDPTNQLQRLSFRAAQVPEPATLGLLGAGLLGLGFMRRKRAA